MKKSGWFLLISSGLVSFLLVFGAGLYGFRYYLLDGRYTREGRAQMTQKQYAAAIETYTQLAALHPKSLVAYEGRGEAYYYSGRYDEAIADYTHALTLAHLEKSKAFCYSWRGVCYAAEKEWDAAIDDYNNALQHDPQRWHTFRLRGYAYAKIKRFNAALSDVNEALHLHPGESSIYATRGVVYGEMGKYAEALADCRAAVAIDPVSSSAWGNLGWEQYKAGKLNQAESSDRRALELNGNDAVPRFNLALCLSVQNRAAEAKKEYGFALADSKARQKEAALRELKAEQAKHPSASAIRESLALFSAAPSNVKSNAPQRKARNESGSENAQ